MGKPYKPCPHSAMNELGSRSESESSSVLSDSLRPHGLQPTRLLHPWDFPGKSTGVGCHRLLWSLSYLLVNVHGHTENLPRQFIFDVLSRLCPDFFAFEILGIFKEAWTCRTIQGCNRGFIITTLTSYDVYFFKCFAFSGISLTLRGIQYWWLLMFIGNYFVNYFSWLITQWQNFWNVTSVVFFIDVWLIYSITLALYIQPKFLVFYRLYCI